MSLEQTVIDNIRRIRKQKGISQERLAEYCGTSTSYIGLMETYKNIPKLSTIERIAEALNVKPETLFLDSEKVNNVQSDEDSRKALQERIKSQIMSSMEKDLDEILKLI